jgi:hypothetical protein
VTIAEAQRTISVEGVTYEVRRLNVRDTFAVARIMSVALARSGDLVSGDLTPQRAGMMFIASIPYAEDEAMKLLGSLIGVTADEIGSMPPDALPEIISVIVEGEDLKAFLAACGRVMKTPGIAEALPKP